MKSEIQDIPLENHNKSLNAGAQNNDDSIVISKNLPVWDIKSSINTMSMRRCDF